MIPSRLSCKLCLNTYDLLERAPWVLSCGHTFCTSCIHGRAAAGQVICPVDNLPDGRDTTAIPLNFQLVELLHTSLAPAAEVG